MDLGDKTGVWWDAHSSCGTCGQKVARISNYRSFTGPALIAKAVVSIRRRDGSRTVQRLVGGRVYG